MGQEDIRLVRGVETSRDHDRPTIFAAIGRQRVGKTTLENALAQIVREKGGAVEVINADTVNRSHSISTFHDDATTAPSVSLEQQAQWMEQTVSRLMVERRDAIIDVGGGHTALHDVIEQTPLADLLEEAGISLVVAYVLGPDDADLDYLDQLMNVSKFRPRHSLVVMNEGLVPLGHDPRKVFENTLRHEVVQQALSQGGEAVYMPALKPMSEVARRGLGYRALLEQAAKDRSITPFNMHRIRQWYTVDFPEFLRAIPPDWLPRLPEGQSY